MNLNAIESGYSVYQNTNQVKKEEKDSKAKTSDTKSESDVAATYDRSSTASNKSSTSTDKSNYSTMNYSKTKTSSADRSSIIAQLKSDSEQRMANMQSLVTTMFRKQGITIGNADDMWKVLASGKFTADPATIAQAKEDISENGYWGVSQTSDRIVSFAVALSGGDAEKMKTMVSAVQKGFKQATKAWGKELPDISNQTYDAVMDKFDNWFKENNSDATTDEILNKQ